MVNNNSIGDIDLFNNKAFAINDLNLDHNDKDIVTSIIINSNKFLTIDSEHYVFEVYIFNYLIRLNNSLAKLNISSITLSQFTYKIFDLCLVKHLQQLPDTILEYGTKLGLCSRSYFSNLIVFPLSYILESKSSTVGLNKFNSPDVLNEVNLLANLCDNLFLNVDDRTKYIILNRNGLIDKKKLTLGEIGINLGITRERVRQLEARFWLKIRQTSKRQLLFDALIFLLLKSGSFIYSTNDSSISLLKLCLEYLKIKYTILENEKILIIGIDDDILYNLYTNLKTTNLDELEKKLAHLFYYDLKIPFSQSDFDRISRVFYKHHTLHITKQSKIYQTMKLIGKPSHYSEIAQKYHEQFGDDEMSEHNIHAILGRECDNIVWIGTRGTYALKEWGYSRPEKTLFASVYEIVNDIYIRTMKPVNINVVISEMSKYRQIASINSITISLSLNKKLIDIGNKNYVPKKHGVNDLNTDSIDTADIDIALTEFEVDNDNLNNLG